MLHTESLPTAGHQGIYAPLRQAMSDSESDEEIEIHNATKHRQLQLQNLQHQQLQPQRSRVPPNTLALKSPHTRAAPTATRIVTRNPTALAGNPQKFQLEGSSYTTNMQNTFRSVMLSDNGGVGSELSHFNSEFDSNADNVAILGGTQGAEDAAKRTPMSPARKCCFIGSLLLCVFAVVSFVWIVPCGNPDGTGSCPAVGDRIKTHNWLNNYTRAELMGGVNVVGGFRAWENNLIFMYRGDAFFPESRPGNERRNGIICLIGSSGAVAWYVEMVDEPVALDCTLVDIDGNGKTDCLVLDESGELGAINALSGEWLWWFKERSARKVDAYDFPIVLPDLDGDGVLDLLLVTSLSLEQRTKSLAQAKPESSSQLEARNVLRLLSGKKGTPIGSGFTSHDCDKLCNLKLEAGNVSFTCQRVNGTEQLRSKGLDVLYTLITNKSIGSQRLLSTAKIAQHRNHGQRREMDAQRNIYSLSGRELVLENRGRCPENCNVTFVLSEVRDGKPNVVQSFSKSGMYGMVPAQWHFKNTKSQMSGFVVKFWKWHGPLKPVKQSSTSSTNNVQKSGSNNHTKNMNAIKDKEKEQAKRKQQQQLQRVKRGSQKQEHEFPPHHEEFDVFEHLIQKRETFGVPSKNQTKTSGLSSSAGYKMQKITETVILVLFVGADTHIENTSQSDIIQFCRHDRNELVCQPDLNNQDHSMLIADLDQDGSQELVTYTSTFVHTDDEQPRNEFKLLTYVRLLRLQAELPAYYEDGRRN
ncbi:uncharacterized protein [Drosophila kikkawai]|uniref:FAM234A/B beta-propeller domain-containing protein n=1 Tax=Drosophila kikkawai TaxID=30033 RepID=A0A6P4JHJ4_DROKI|nr:uncharacterized protein LOC108083686 [Drosophila kikkawai]